LACPSPFFRHPLSSFIAARDDGEDLRHRPPLVKIVERSRQMGKPIATTFPTAK
jgi:hypothetical protein